MLNRKKNNAIKALQRQKQKIEDKSHYDDWDWVAQTADVVKKYIGEDSALHDTITQFKFGVGHHCQLTNDQILAGFDAKKRTISRYIDKCIEYIELNGIKKEPKINFLLKLSDKVVWSILIGIGTFGFFLGNFLKSVEIDKEKIQLEEEVKNLSKQIEDYKLIITESAKSSISNDQNTEKKDSVK